MDIYKCLKYYKNVCCNDTFGCGGCPFSYKDIRHALSCLEIKQVSFPLKRTFSRRDTRAYQAMVQKFGEESTIIFEQSYQEVE